MANGRIPLSVLFRNPVVRAAFERAECDYKTPLVVVSSSMPRLIGSAGESLKWRLNLEAMAKARA